MNSNRTKNSENKEKRLSAEDIYGLTLEVLQAHFGLAREDARYDEQAIWDVIIAASVERETVETMSDILEDSPSANTVREAVKGVLPDDENIDELEAELNEMLQAHVPKKLLSRPLRCAIDLVAIPYHGKHDDGDEAIRRGKAKSGTTHFHTYATLYTVKHNKRYTLALVFVRKSDKALDVLEKLQKRADELHVGVKRLLLDREFDNNGVIGYLKKQSFPSIIPLTIRGKEGGTRALVKGRQKRYVTTYTRNSTIYPTETFTVHVACKYSQGRYKRQGIVCFAYIVIGELKMPPLQIYTAYRFRFGIESSYRLMNQVRARTTSKAATLRLFYIGLALLMLNLWSFVKWSYLFVSRSGPRQVLHRLLPLARWRLWLWEVIKLRLGFSLDIVIPSPA